MPEELGFLTMNVQATALRPLLGLTVLLVEDSRFASEAVRLLCIRSGARIRRADCLKSAARHLRIYRPSVVIIDLGLPDGSGLDLIKTLADSDGAHRPVIIATSGADGEGQIDAALAAGADEFMPKPIQTVAAFQQTILQHLPEEMRPAGPRLVSDEVVAPDTLALNEDLSHLDELLRSGDTESLPYIAPFLQGLARLADDQKLKSVSDRLSKAVEKDSGVPDAVSRTRAVIQSRLANAQLV